MEHMIVSYQTTYHETDGPVINGKISYFASLVKEVKFLNVEFCCAQMHLAWERKHIVFGSRPEDTYKNKLPEVTIKVEEPFPIARHLVLSYCPFCGQPIETSELKDVAYA